jgi:hypothetical protein
VATEVIQPLLVDGEGHILPEFMPAGGRRAGAGRRPGSEPPKQVLTVRLPPELKQWVEEKGGSDWLRELLSEMRIRESCDPTRNK